jgi:hypothetical protein
MERYFLRSDKDNFWFVLISDKVESYMYKFTVTENEPPKMYRYVGNEPIDLSTFYELTDINPFSLVHEIRYPRKWSLPFLIVTSSPK